MKKMSLIITAVHTVERRFRRAVAIAVGIGSFGLGLSLLLYPATLGDVRSLKFTFGFAEPGAWGFIVAALGVLLVSTAVMSSRTIVWPATGLSLWFTAFSVSILFGAGTAIPVPLVVWAYLTIGTICGFVALSSVTVHVQE